MRSILICVLISAFVPLNLKGIEADQIEAVFESFENQGGKPVGSVLIAQAEKVIFAEGFGLADASQQQMNRPNTQFLIGSVTKQFTAAALLKTIYEMVLFWKPDAPEQEILEEVNTFLNLPLSFYLPSVHEIWRGHPPSWLDSVTLHHLLTHTSGIPNYTQDPTFHDFAQSDHDSYEDILELFTGKELEFTPGSKWNYSNSGYYLIGMVVEYWSPKGLQDYLETTFFKPLGMESTFLQTTGRLPQFKLQLPRLARGYGWDSYDATLPLTEQTLYEHMLHPFASGAMISTVEDLHRWNVALYHKGEVLPPFLVELMTHPHMPMQPDEPDFCYGYGLMITNTPHGQVIDHGGGIPGFTASLQYYPKQKLTLVALKNVSENIEQAVALLKKMRQTFSHIQDKEKQRKAIRTHLKKHYPTISQQDKTYDFMAPLIEEIEKEIASPL